MEQGHNQNHSTAGQSYSRMGRAVDPESGSFVHPVNNVLRGGVQFSPRWNSETRTNEYPPRFSTEVLHFRPSFPGPTSDVFSQSSAAGNIYPNSQNNSYYYRHCTHETEGGKDPVMDTSRRPFKRKSPSVSLSYERGSSSRSFSEGSSSGSSERILEKPIPNYQNNPLRPFGLPHHRDGNSSFSGESSSRNVRSRSRLDMEAGSTGAHLSGFSYHYHSTNNPGAVQISNMNVDEPTRGWSFVPPSPAGHDAIGMRHTSNQYFASGNATEIGASHHDSVPNSHSFSSSQYFHSPSFQAARGVNNSISRRAMTSSRACMSYPRLGHEAPTLQNGLQSSRETHSSRYSGGGSHNSYRNGSSRMAMERFQSTSRMVGVHERMGSESLSMMDYSSSYAGSGSWLDQHGDLRLDIDDMSYEELLDLGERIGNVSMGLPEDMILKSLSEKRYYLSDQVNEKGTCAICLEEYENGDKVGSMKNCGHDYHTGCIRKWLSMKNVCPICKAPALEDSSKQQ